MVWVSNVLSMRRPWRPVGAAAFLVLSTCAPALGEGGESVLDSGSIYNALWAVGIFAVLVIVLGRYAWRPILRAVQERERHIADSVRHADAVRAQSEEAMRQSQATLMEAREAAERHLAEAKEAAAAAKAEIMAAARAETAQMARRTAAEIESAKRQAVDELREFAAELATEAAGRIVRKQLSPEDQRRIVAESLERIRSKAVRN